MTPANSPSATSAPPPHHIQRRCFGALNQMTSLSVRTFPLRRSGNTPPLLSLPARRKLRWSYSIHSTLFLQVILEGNIKAANGLFGFDNLVFSTNRKCTPRWHKMIGYKLTDITTKWTSVDRWMAKIFLYPRYKEVFQCPFIYFHCLSEKMQSMGLGLQKMI
jgi:hypothetical protein